MSSEFPSRWVDRDPHDSDSFDYDDEEHDTEEDDVIPCPACHREVYELAERCPHCGEYITLGDQPWAYQSHARRRLIKWVLLLMLVALLLPFLFALFQLAVAALAST